MNEGYPLPNPESKTDITELYLKPYVIAEQIRVLKKEYSDSEKFPGLERKIEIEENYEILKEKRGDAKEMILENLEKVGDSPKRIIKAATGKMEEAQTYFDLAKKQGNEIALKEAVKRWHIANDFVQLLERDLNDLTLEEEDEGLELNLK